MAGKTNEWVKNEWIDVRMDGLTARWMDERMDGWMDGWMDWLTDWASERISSRYRGFQITLESTFWFALICVSKLFHWFSYSWCFCLFSQSDAGIFWLVYYMLFVAIIISPAISNGTYRIPARCMTATLTFFHGSLFRHLQVEDWCNCDFLFVFLHRSCKCSLTKMTTGSNHHSQLEEKENIETYARNACKDLELRSCNSKTLQIDNLQRNRCSQFWSMWHARAQKGCLL